MQDAVAHGEETSQRGEGSGGGGVLRPKSRSVGLKLKIAKIISRKRHPPPILTLWFGSANEWKLVLKKESVL